MPIWPRLDFRHWSRGDSITNRTAVYGPVCTVVWEGRRSDPPPYPDLKPAPRRKATSINDTRRVSPARVESGPKRNGQVTEVGPNLRKHRGCFRNQASSVVSIGIVCSSTLLIFSASLRGVNGFWIKP